MNINNEPKLDFDDVYITPRPTELKSRSEVNLDVSYITKHSKKEIRSLPVFVANMDKIGVPEMAYALHEYKIGICLHKHFTVEEIMDFYKYKLSTYSFISFGISEQDFAKLNRISLEEVKPSKICLDVANGYMYEFLDKIKRVRDMFPNTIIMAGNVCTPEGVENIIKAGADIAKCGIGQGSKCETKSKAGVSYKQFSCAIECGQAANELNALCCSDGGIKTPADICKALAAGSHFAMCGGLFFGYDENDTEWEEIDGKNMMLSYGMSSAKANDKFFGGLKDYRTSEGLEEYVASKGPVSQVAKDIRGGLASACTYTNTKNLENLKKNATFSK